MELTKNFQLEQFTKSEYGTRHNIEEQFRPPSEIVTKLHALCEHLLEPLRAAIIAEYPGAEVRFTSGYRCPRVNKGIGGSSSSQHMQGEAVDCELYINGIERNADLAKIVINNKLDYDQMILEFGSMERPNWIHLSWDLDKPKQRKMILRIDTKEGRVRTYGITPNTVLTIK